MATTERLLAAAADEFGRVGYDAARLEDIAHAVGISRPSLLYHFKTKADLYEAVVRASFRTLADDLQAAMEGEGTFPEQLDRLLGGFVAYTDAHPKVSALLLREVLDGHGPGHDLLLRYGVPLLDQVEAFVLGAGEGALRPGVPVRAALLEIVATAFVRAASGPLRLPLWGATDFTQRLGRLLFLKPTAGGGAP